MFTVLLLSGLAIGNDSESTSSVVAQEAMTRTELESYRRIHIGMTRKEVEERLGEKPFLNALYGVQLKCALSRYDKSNLIVDYDGRGIVSGVCRIKNGTYALEPE